MTLPRHERRYDYLVNLRYLLLPALATARRLDDLAYKAGDRKLYLELARIVDKIQGELMPQAAEEAAKRGREET